MSTIKQFEDIEAWKEARELNKLIFLRFKDNKNYSFKDQLFRASLSILNNIAEGFERNSDKEFQRFLKISKGSAGEVRSMLWIGFDMNYIEKHECESLINKTKSISIKLSGLIKYLNK